MASEILTKLIEERDAAKAAYTAFTAPIIAEKRSALTEDETTKREELRSALDALTARIKEVDADERADAELEEVRNRAGVNVTDIRVTSEPRTYGEGSPNSYFADLVRSSSFGWKDHDGAKARLNRYSHELSVEAAAGSAEGRRAEKMVLSGARTDNGQEARSAVSALRESRAMDTGSGSGGSFVTPQYFESDYAPFRQFGRAFIDNCNVQDLPEYGMTVYLPALSGPAGVASQSTQNTGVTETDPTAGYISNNLTTLAGEVTISQQLLDRAGPNFAFDKMVFDQLTRAYNQQADAYALTAALANAGTITYTAGSFSLPAFWSKVAGAKAATASTSGTILPATHLFATPARWSFAEAQVDSQNRPLIVPNYAGAFNAGAAGSDGTPVVEGNTGYRMLGLNVFEDGSIPTPGTGADQVIVAHMPEVWVWEGPLTPRVIPQTYAQNLSVLLQTYSYITAIVRYPKAVQTITGTGLGSITF
jgi:HK97 family phage major capsid protein